MRYASSLMFLAALLLAAGAAQAGPVVVHSPALDVDQATARAKATYTDRAFRVAGALNTLVDGRPEALTIVSATFEKCTHSRTDSLGRGLVEARNQLIAMEYESVVDRLKTIEAILPCGAEGASRTELYDLFFLQGVAHFNAGNEQESTRLFRKAAIIDPQRTWNSRYPPQIKALWVTAVAAVLQTKPMTLQTEVDLIIVDGEQLGDGGSVELFPGDHIVSSAAGALLVTIPYDGQRAERKALVTTNAQLVRGLSIGAEEYAPWLADQAVTRKWEEVLLVTEDGNFPLENRSLSGKRRSTKSIDVVPVLGVALLAAGGASAGVGLGLHLGSFQAAGIQDGGTVMVGAEAYGGLVTQNQGGFATAIAGGVMVGVGAALAAAGASRKAKGIAAAPFVVPTAAGGVAFGFGGRF
jgi:hypothetical protein